MVIEFAGRVDIGPRESNDDRVLVGNQILNMTSHAGVCETPAIAVVCDGCGGYAGGGIASQTVLETLGSYPITELMDENNLAQALEECRKRVYEKKNENPQFAQMCTTIAGCIFAEDRTIFFHAGDSRIYRFDGKYITRMTKDHSSVQQLVDMGKLTNEEARIAPNRNIINRCIGIECPPPEINISSVPIGENETYLLCSDGLWEMFSDKQIAEYLSEDVPLAVKVNRLVYNALSVGGDDNTSVCLCHRPGSLDNQADQDSDKQPFVLD